MPLCHVEAYGFRHGKVSSRDMEGREFGNSPVVPSLWGRSIAGAFFQASYDPCASSRYAYRAMTRRRRGFSAAGGPGGPATPSRWSVPLSFSVLLRAGRGHAQRPSGGAVRPGPTALGDGGFCVIPGSADRFSARTEPTSPGGRVRLPGVWRAIASAAGGSGPRSGPPRRNGEGAGE